VNSTTLLHSTLTTGVDRRTGCPIRRHDRNYGGIGIGRDSLGVEDDRNHGDADYEAEPYMVLSGPPTLPRSSCVARLLDLAEVALAGLGQDVLGNLLLRTHEGGVVRDPHTD
jgi:hypothetical protein